KWFQRSSATLTRSLEREFVERCNCRTNLVCAKYNRDRVRNDGSRYRRRLINGASSRCQPDALWLGAVNVSTVATSGSLLPCHWPAPGANARLGAPGLNVHVDGRESRRPRA